MSHLAGHALPLNVHSSTYCAAAMHMDKDKVLHFGVGELHLDELGKSLRSHQPQHRREVKNTCHCCKVALGDLATSQAWVL